VRETGPATPQQKEDHVDVVGSILGHERAHFVHRRVARNGSVLQIPQCTAKLAGAGRSNQNLEGQSASACTEANRIGRYSYRNPRTSHDREWMALQDGVQHVHLYPEVFGLFVVRRRMRMKASIRGFVS
jgi:hypothetical protein